VNDYECVTGKVFFVDFLYQCEFFIVIILNTSKGGYILLLTVGYCCKCYLPSLIIGREIFDFSRIF